MFLITKIDRRCSWPIICTYTKISMNNNYNIVWGNKAYSLIAKTHIPAISDNITDRLAAPPALLLWVITEVCNYYYQFTFVLIYFTLFFNKSAQEMAEERVKMRLEILTKEAEANPNMERTTLTFIAVADKGIYTFTCTVSFI